MYLVFLSGNRKCYFTELLVNLYSPGCTGLSALLEGLCSLVLSEETWVRDGEGIVKVFPEVSEDQWTKSPVCSWDVITFPSLL